MDEGLNEETPTFTLQNSSEALFCIQRLDFKTCLLEAVEELRMRRDSEIGYEKQIHKLVVEKQELEWQKVALQQQKEALNQQHTEAMSALKKQFQARTLSMEEEKGKYRLAEEAKEREMEGLKETLKKLQISKYTLQKKLKEMEQKLQLHLLAKEDHQKNVNEFEKCHATITCQFGIIKGNHEKLEQNVMEAIQLNKKLKDVNERQASEIDNLKKELKEVTADLLRSKITCHHRVAEENLKLTAKEQELQELQQKNTAETELNTKIIEENIQLKEEKKELIVSLQHIQQLLCRQTETNTRIEMELNKLKKECQTLERDNELQREKAKENEEKFFILQNEHNKTQTTWNNEARDMPNKNEMHTGNKKNKYTQTTIIISNNLPQGENGTKDVLSSTFHPTIKPTEQNSALVCVFEENSHVSTEDSDKVENCVNEDDTVHPFNKQPRKDSLSKTSSIEPGSSDGSYVFEYKETANKRENIEKEFHKMQAVAEIEPLDSSYPLRHLVAKEDNKLLESIEDLEDSVSNPDTDDCRGLNKPRLDIGVGLVSEKKEIITNALHKIASSTSDAFSKDSKLHDGINEKTVSNHLSSEIDLLKSQMPANDTAIQQDFLDKICSAKQTLSSHGNSTITSKILLCKQVNTSLGEVHRDGMCTNNKCDEQVNSFSTSENISPSHASFDNNSGVDSHITNEEGINKSTLVRSINLYGGKPCKGINEIASECANKDSSRLRDTSIKTPEILSLNTENVHEFQSVDLIANHITREKQRNFHTSKTTGEESVPVSEALNEREEPLRGKAAGEESAKEGTEEPGSLPMGTNMDFINRTARPSFEPATMEKKAEKTAVQLDLPREYQGEIQTMCASKVETYLKEKLLLQEINNSQNSKESGPSMSIYAGVKEEALVSTHFKTVSDTLNARNINADPKRYCSEERNVMQKSLRDPSFPTENVTTAHPSESQQKFSQIPSEASGDILNESSNNREETGWNLQNVFIKTQISKIEKLLYSERFCQPRKRKHEEDSEAAAKSKNSEM